MSIGTEKERFNFVIDEIIDLKLHEQHCYNVADDESEEIAEAKMKENYEILAALIEKKIAEVKLEFLMLMKK